MKPKAKVWLRRAAAAGVVVALALVLAAYGLLGRTRPIRLAEQVVVFHTGSFGRTIGANVTAVDTSDGLILVDAQLAPLASRLQRKVAKQFSGPVRAVINTHWHPDHTGGNDVLRGGGEVIAHGSVRQRLASVQEGHGLTRPGSEHVFAARPERALPSVQVDSVYQASGPGMSVVAEHVPAAHTEGDVVVWIDGDRILCIGDLVWPGSFPFIDTHTGGTAPGLLIGLERLLERLPQGAIVIPGHGLSMDRATLAAYVDVVRQTSDAVLALREGGLSLEQAQQAGLDPRWDAWSSRLVPTSEWIRMIYETSPDGGSSPEP